MKAEAGSTRLVDALLPDDHIAVKTFLNKCQSNRPDGNDATVLESMQTGAGWPKCFRRVEKVREIMAGLFGREARDFFFSELVLCNL